jgi:hypothetical protein
MAASTRSDTRGRERTTAVNGGRGEAVSGGAVGARHARRRGREVAVGTHVRRGAGAWQPCDDVAGSGA